MKEQSNEDCKKEEEEADDILPKFGGGISPKEDQELKIKQGSSLDSGSIDEYGTTHCLEMEEFEKLTAACN